MASSTTEKCKSEAGSGSSSNNEAEILRRISLLEKEISMRKKEISMQEKEISLLKKQNSLLREHSLLKKEFFAYQIEEDELVYLYDVTDSSAHVTTGHAPSTTTSREVGDKWIDPNWPQLGKLVTYTADSEDPSVNSKGDTLHRVYSLIRAVLRSLGLNKHLSLYLNISIMGVEGDIVVCWKYNKMPIGSFEVKKPKANLGKKILEQVLGQVFDQMHTYRLGGPNQVFSVVTTFNEWQLHSTDSLSNDFVNDVLDNWKEKLESYSELSRNVPQSPSSRATTATDDISPEAYFRFMGHDEIDRKMEDSEIEDSEMEGEKKTGRRGKNISNIVEKELVIKREHFASEVVSLKKDKEEGDHTNYSKAVVNLIATSFLLMLESTKNRVHKPRIVNKPLRGPVRILAVGKTETFSFKFGILEKGIDFDRYVEHNEKNFLVWFPLGFGESATCCLASSDPRDNSSAGRSCVVKFYQPKSGLDIKK